MLLRLGTGSVHICQGVRIFLLGIRVILFNAACEGVIQLLVRESDHDLHPAVLLPVLLRVVGGDGQPLALALVGDPGGAIRVSRMSTSARNTKT